MTEVTWGSDVDQGRPANGEYNLNGYKINHAFRARFIYRKGKKEIKGK